MNLRKPILYILLIVFGLILLYNYLIAPSLMPYNNGMGMGMGMHRGTYNTTNYFIDFRLILFIGIVIIGLFFMEIMKSQPSNNVCSRCGKIIESNQWRICPSCGTPVNKRGDS